MKTVITWLATATAETKKAYAASGIAATVSVLTFSEVIGMVGLIVSVLLGAITAWSNHKRNKKHIELMDHQIHGVSITDKQNDELNNS